ncbi:MAG: type 4a pilus biogenesis protein PilO [Candidatus Omnitrophota bacterium]
MIKRKSGPSQRQLVIGGVFVFLVVTVYFKFLLGPAFGELRSKRVELGRLKQDLTSLKTAQAKLPEIQAGIARLREKSMELETRFPSKEELPGLLERLSEVAEKAQVKIVEIHPSELLRSEKKSSGPFEELPIAITAKSGYHELGAFINQLENSERIFAVKDIKIKSDSLDEKRHHVKLVVGTFVRERGNP